jgi:hypothetical protein
VYIGGIDEWEYERCCWKVTGQLQEEILQADPFVLLRAGAECFF